MTNRTITLNLFLATLLVVTMVMAGMACGPRQPSEITPRVGSDEWFYQTRYNHHMQMITPKTVIADEVTTAALFKMLADNPIRVHNTYKDNQITLTGKIDQIEGASRSEYKRLVFLGNFWRGKQRYMIICAFNSVEFISPNASIENREIISRAFDENISRVIGQLHVGQQVTLTGKVTLVEDARIGIQYCRLIKPEL